MGTSRMSSRMGTRPSLDSSQDLMRIAHSQPTLTSWQQEAISSVRPVLLAFFSLVFLCLAFTTLLSILPPHGLQSVERSLEAGWPRNPTRTRNQNSQSFILSRNRKRKQNHRKRFPEPKPERALLTGSLNRIPNPNPRIPSLVEFSVSTQVPKRNSY